MNDRIPDVPPKIAPVSEDADRPLWSIMIPTYNCIEFLEETIKSVLVQDMGAAVMQIEVVDDCSTDGDVAALVEAVGNGRVYYFKQEYNLGSLRNFETCLNHSKGYFVHLLHGDDLVKPGFYKEIESLFTTYPEAGAAFTNFSTIKSGHDSPILNKPICDQLGIVDDILFKLSRRLLLQPPSVVVKRAVYENLGGFFAVCYGEDWEMWVRIASKYAIAYSPKHLATYRFMGKGSITLNSHLSGQNVRDMIKITKIVQNHLPVEKRDKRKVNDKKLYSQIMAQAAHTIYVDYPDTAFLRVKEAWKTHKNVKTLYFVVKLYLKKLVGFKGNRPLSSKRH